MELQSCTLTELRDNISDKKMSCEEVVSYFLEQTKKWNSKVNAFVTVDEITALKNAKSLDQKLSKGENIGSLGGIPLGIKDLLCTKGLLTTAGSKILENFVPPYSATIVNKLKNDGAIILGKTNLDEFAMGSSNETSFFGPCLNPWDHERVAGGSSGGSAAAVARGMVPGSIGTDTGGSIRQPASFCGVVGIKPTYGRVSRYGIIAFASSLDQAGPMANNVRDATLILQSICGHDPMDATSSLKNVPRWEDDLHEEIKSLKVGVVSEFFHNEMDSQVRDSIENCKKLFVKLGAELVDVSLPSTSTAVATYYLIATSEASSNLARYDGVRYGRRFDFKNEPPQNLREFYSRTRGDGFGDEVKRRILLGTFALSSGYYDEYYNRACRVRGKLLSEYNTAFEKCDVLVGPVSTHPAFKLNEKISDPLKMYNNDINTTSASLCGLPCMSLPVGATDENLPVGLQIIAPQFGESKMLNLAYALEKALNLKEAPHALR